MRILLTVLLIIFTSSFFNLNAQLKDWGVDYKFLYPKNIEDNPLSNIYDEGEFTRGIQASFRKNFNNWLSLNVPLRLGRVEVRDEVSNRIRKNGFIGIDGVVNVGIDPLKFGFGPYALLGVGVDYQEIANDFNVYIPAGFGVNIKLQRELLLNAELQRRTALDDNNTYYQAALGLIFNLGLDPEEEEKATLNIPPVDSDGDGVPDSEDACPGFAGPAMFRGCPDSDNDGIIDSKDKCPNEAGPLATDGCPVKVAGNGMGDQKDSDGDGVIDANDNCPTLKGDPANFGCPSEDADNDGVLDILDACPNLPGLERFGGCPDSDGDGIGDDKDACPTTVGLAKFSGCPDTDGDGISDAADKCPTVVGTAANNGCPSAPVISNPVVTSPSPVIRTEVLTSLAEASQDVEFETSRATLRTSSYVVLDKIVKIMNDYPSYYIEVGGHTDSIGSSADNQKLSENRAKSCRDYLVSKGVDSKRITFVGYGEKQPIADNRYMDGRKKNRRVEFKMIPR